MWNEKDMIDRLERKEWVEQEQRKIIHTTTNRNNNRIIWEVMHTLWPIRDVRINLHMVSTMCLTCTLVCKMSKTSTNYILIICTKFTRSIWIKLTILKFQCYIWRISYYFCMYCYLIYWHHDKFPNEIYTKSLRVAL